MNSITVNATKWCLCAVFAMVCGMAHATLLQHLDATISASVTNNPVSVWADQSGNGNDALEGEGSVYYPSTSLSTSGNAGLDFGTSRNSLVLFSVADSASWLDQSAGTGGFCVLVALKCDQVNTNANAHNDIIGNSTAVGEGFGIRYSTSGDIKAYLNGLIDHSGVAVMNGDTVVMAFNYDASNGGYEFWDSNNSNSVTGTRIANNFVTANAVSLGSTTSGLRYLDGMVGEVKIFDAALSESEFAAEQTALVNKWILNTEPVSNQAPIVSIISPTNGITITEGDSLTVQANATDPDGSIALVKLWMKEEMEENYSLVGDVTLPISPDVYEWDSSSFPLLANIPQGTYALRAVAIDDDGENDGKGITVYVIESSPEPLTYNDWMSAYELSETDADPLANPDGDEYNNLLEFALGGSPTNALDENLVIPELTAVEDTGTEYAEFTYQRRIHSDDIGLEYVIEHVGNLTDVWTTNDVAEISASTNNVPTGFEEVVVRFETTNSQYYAHLKLIYNDPSTGPIEIIVPAETEQLLFAKTELESALEETTNTQGIVQISISVAPAARSMAPVTLAVSENTESYEIKRVGNKLEITGSDQSGAMYGALEVAEYLKLGLPITNVSRSPFVKKRGIKFNIPLDARSPSYDDSGDSSNHNIQNMWDFEGFWKPYIDGLARDRYNVLSLWTRHPFPHLVDLSEKYPTINPDNQHVYRVKDGVLQYNTKGKTIVKMLAVDDCNFKSADSNEWVYRYDEGFLDPDGDRQVNMDLLHQVDGQDGITLFDTIEKKIAHWQQVFDYANDRGLEVSMIYWNVFTPGAVGHASVDTPDAKITQDQTNDATIEYVRHAVKQFILTYPQIEAIGVIAGEHDIEDNWDGPYAGKEEEYNTERYVYKTYGLGLKDALAEQPGRDVKFIWRAHSMNFDYAKQYFTSQYDPDNTGLVQGSIKYCIGRLYSSRTIGEQEWYRRAKEFLNDTDYDYKIWLNIRNDDLFIHRWGSSDYVREFIKNMPHEHIPGFYMGSDGYVWGKDYFTKTENMNGQLEIDKHWYNFRLWGQLAYNNEIGEAYWIATLKHHFGLTDDNAEKLFYAWEQVSEVVPEVIRSHWASSDAGLAVEGAQNAFNNSTGFIPFYKFFYNEGPQFATTYKYIPMTLGDSPASIELPSLWVPDWGHAYTNNTLAELDTPDVLTPLEVADRLDGYADEVDLVIGDLESGNVTPEFQELLWDLQSMAQLGRFYADRTRAAAFYWVARSDNFSVDYATELADAQMYIRDAARHWRDYANILDEHYEPQVLSRTHVLDWQNTLNHNGDGISGNRATIPLQTVMDEARAMLHQFDGRPVVENPEDPEEDWEYTYDGTDVKDNNWLQNFPDEDGESAFLSQPYEAN